MSVCRESEHKFRTCPPDKYPKFKSAVSPETRTIWQAMNEACKDMVRKQEPDRVKEILEFQKRLLLRGSIALPPSALKTEEEPMSDKKDNP